MKEFISSLMLACGIAMATVALAATVVWYDQAYHQKDARISVLEKQVQDLQTRMDACRVEMGAH